MTIIEKANAYDEAVENMRKFRNALNNHEETDLWVSKKDIVTDIEYYFPELKESEDEKIRKLLIRLFTSNANEKFDDVSTEKILVWLEKQVPIDEDKIVKGIKRGVAISLMNHIDANSKGMCLSNMECEDIENAIINEDWDKVYGYMKKKLSQQEVTKKSDQEEGFIEIPFGAYDSEFIGDTYFIPEGCYAVIVDDMVVIKKGERKPAWREEDERRVKDTIYFLDTAKKHYASTVELDACIDWLKSLKDKVQPQPQPKQGWSEEDEKMLDDAIGAVGAADYYTYDDKQEIENWLKSLKQRIGG